MGKETNEQLDKRSFNLGRKIKSLNEKIKKYNI